MSKNDYGITERQLNYLRSLVRQVGGVDEANRIVNGRGHPLNPFTPSLCDNGERVAPITYAPRRAASEAIDLLRAALDNTSNS